jgi:hypothetical protein
MSEHNEGINEKGEIVEKATRASIVAVTREIFTTFHVEINSLIHEKRGEMGGKRTELL